MKNLALTTAVNTILDSG